MKLGKLIAFVALNILFAYQLYPIIYGERVVASVLPSLVEINVTKRDGNTVHGVQGSGVFVSKSGRILTCAHLFGHKGMEGATITVTYLDGSQKGEAILVAISPKEDLALIRLSSAPSSAITVSRLRTRTLCRGEEVYVVGAPFGLPGTVTKGIVSGVNRTSLMRVQTDAVLNPGNSGGPVFDRSGHLVGIANSILPLPVWVGQGFFVNASQIAEFLNSLA